MIGGNTGSKTWIDTMKKELELLGHNVTLYTPNTNILDMKFDLAIINHNSCLKQLTYLPCKKIFTSHGILPALEQPIKGADIYISVSEEVQQHLRELGYESTVIRNGIDCEIYKSTKPTNTTLKNVLFSSHYQGSALPIIKQACNELGLNLTIIGKGNEVSNAIDYINDADLVIGLGRTAYESMACERNVIIYDYNGADGFVTPETILDYRKNNCSGRYNKKFLSVEEFKAMLFMYDNSLGKQLRNYILDNNNITQTVKQYLSL